MDDRRRLSWADLGFASRLLVAGLGAFGAARLLGLHTPYSAVFSALIVSRPYSEGAWAAAGGRLLATAAGIAVSFGALWLKGTGLNDFALLFLALAPLSVLAAWDQSYRTALITVLIMLSVGATTAALEMESALARGLTVALGAVIGVLVSALVLPQAHDRVVATQARRVTNVMLRQMGLFLQDGADPWRIERGDREVRKTLLEIGRASRDHGRRAAQDNPSARMIGLVRYVQSALLMLRTESRKLKPEERVGRATWVRGVADYFSAPIEQASDAVTRLREQLKAFAPGPMELMLSTALLNSLTTLKALTASPS